MKNKFKTKIEKIDFTNHNETGKLSEDIACSSLSNNDKIELLELITDRKLEAELKLDSIMDLKQLVEKLDNEGEFNYED